MKDTLKKRIDLFTGNRADYGLLRPLINALSEDKRFETRLVVGGEHSWNDTTRNEIKLDTTGVEVCELFSPKKGEELKQASVSKRMALHQLEIEAFWKNSHPPNTLVLLGDRYEAVGIATCAFSNDIPIMHLAAGDITLGGALDDQFRFSISAMAHTLVAFSTQSYNTLCATPNLKHKPMLLTASLAVDNALSVPVVDVNTLFNKYNLNLGKPLYLFTQHGIQSEKEFNWLNIQASLEAISECTEAQFLVTGSNSDVDNEDLNSKIQHFIEPYPHLQYTHSTGYHDYISLLRNARGVIGNSSSGLYETPLFKIGCLNIGTRQQGREHSSNVIHCPYGKNAVKQAFQTLHLGSDFSQHVLRAYELSSTTPAVPHLLKFLS
jgi:GDP/UDP-N,N'-diacetylbacillosamine 2-epimerase (hydrolysing)